MDPSSELPADAPTADAAPTAAARRVGPGARLLLVGALFLGLLVTAHLTGLSERSPQELLTSLREGMAAAGAWGVLLFVVVFLVGELLQVPGLVFVAAAVLSYGHVRGGVLSYLTAVLSVCFSFAVVRAVGGEALGELRRPWVKRVLDRLDERPVRTVAVLRVVLLMSPPLNYALALTRIRFGAYLVGSALGLLPPVVAFVVFFERVMAWAGLE